MRHKNRYPVNQRTRNGEATSLVDSLHLKRPKAVTDTHFTDKESNNIKNTSLDDSLHLKRPKTVPTCVIKRSVVPASFFPRYEYALENFRDIQRRYSNVFCPPQRRKLPLGNVALYFCKSDDESDFPLNVHDLVSTDSCTELISEDIIHFKNGYLPTENSSIFPVFVVTEHTKEISSRARQGNALVAIVVRTRREANAISRRYSYRSKKFVLIIRRKTAGKQLNMLLERAMFHTLTPLCETLFQYLEYTRSKKGPEIHRKRRRMPVTNKVPYKVSKKEKRRHNDTHKTSPFQKRHDNILSDDEVHTDEQDDKPVERRSGRKRTNVYTSPQIANCTKTEFSKKCTLCSKLFDYDSNRQQFPPWLGVNENNLKSLDDKTKECLLEELLGLYNMSDVPDIERPRIPDSRKRLDLDAVKNDIFAVDPAITGVGYRCGKLQIVVQEGTRRKERHIRNKIREVLDQNKTEEFDIVRMSLKKYLTAGDEICVGRARGSFGCFANMHEDKGPTLCGLLSKHVAVGLGEVCVTDGDQVLSVGEVLPETVTDEGLDIAAAKLHIKQNTCEAQFKSSRGRPRKTGRNRFNSADELRGHKVHIWGAKSKPGKGIITVPDYKCKGMDNSLIQVEDIVDGDQNIIDRFAQSGDSGAVICADDPDQDCVHPVSMNMGCMNYEDVEKDDKNKVRKMRGKYLTVPLPSGMKELQKRTGHVFNLC